MRETKNSKFLADADAMSRAGTGKSILGVHADPQAERQRRDAIKEIARVSADHSAKDEMQSMVASTYARSLISTYKNNARAQERLRSFPADSGERMEREAFGNRNKSPEAFEDAITAAMDTLGSFATVDALNVIRDVWEETPSLGRISPSDAVAQKAAEIRKGIAEARAQEIQYIIRGE